MSRLKKLALNLTLLLGSLIFILALGEGGARVYVSYQKRKLEEIYRENVLTRPARLSDIYVEQQPEGYGNKPNFYADWWGIHVRTDSLGCRLGSPAPEASRVILFIGDSMVFGLGLDDSLTIPNLVQERLNAALPSRPCRMVNAGVVGYDFQDYLHSVRRFVPRVKPELILIGIANNDLYPTEDPFGNVLALRGKAPERKQEMPPPSRGFFQIVPKVFSGMLSSSALYRVFRQSSSQLRLSASHGRDYDLLREGAAGEVAAQVDESIKLLTGIGIPYAFVYFPEYVNLSKPADYVYAKLLRERGQPLIDLCQNAGLALESYFFVDLKKSGGEVLPQSHFCSKGSRQAAAAIAQSLLEKRLWI
jgi:hypothetical protein